MQNSLLKHTANEDFSRARAKEFRQRIFNILTPARNELLKLDEVKALVRPDSEMHHGLQTIPIYRIIGSEGRFRDFNKVFLPRKHYLRSRWTSLDQAYLSNIVLPPVHLYEIGGVYFVRDGNHRVSVARLLGQQEIDAIVISLHTELKLDVHTTIEKLRRQVISLEKEAFYNATGFSSVFPGYDLQFTNIGRYQVIKKNLDIHAQHLKNKEGVDRIPFRSVVLDWFQSVFFQITTIIRDEHLLVLFPKKTEADITLWIIEHKSLLIETEQKDLSYFDAAQSYLAKFGKGIIRNTIRALFRFFKKHSRRSLRRLFKKK